MNKTFLRSPIFHISWILRLLGEYFAYKLNARLYPGPRIEDSGTSIIGFNHVGIHVQDLD
ncbi:MAG: hypothetical protein AAF696_17105 [Bacteroidota bacterium]